MKQQESTAKILSNEENYKYKFILEDNLVNLMSGLGGKLDKRTYAEFSGRNIDQKELAAMYRHDWLTGKVCDIVPEDMTREGRTFKAEQDLIDKTLEEENRLNFWHHIIQAHVWSRLHGTGFIILAVNDNKLPSEPLDLKSLKAGQLSHITALDRYRIQPFIESQIEDALNPDFGKPEKYILNGTSTYIHHTRVIRIEGIPLTFEEFRQNNFISGSIVERLYSTLINFGTVTDGIASMIYDTNVEVYKIKGLLDKLATSNGTQLVQKRIMLANQMKSFNKALILDSDEEHNVQTKTFSGLDSLIVEYGQLLSAASDIPATRLLGTSPKGLNATGDSDLNNYYNMIRSKQNRLYGPILHKLDTLIQLNAGIPLEGENPLPYKWNPLKHMSEEEMATLENNRAQRDQTYLTAGVVPESVVAKELLNLGTYSALTEEHVKELEHVEEDYDEDEEMASSDEPESDSETEEIVSPDESDSETEEKDE